MKKVHFFVDGGKSAGFGHISRCHALSQAFEELGYATRLIINADKKASIHLSGKNIIISNWLEDISQNPHCDSDLVVVDSYKASFDLYNYFSLRNSSALFLDDNIRLTYPRGIVLNGSIFAEKMNYPQSVSIQYLLGTEYTLLRSAFWKVPDKAIADEIQNVLITMGGSDLKNLTPMVIELLEYMAPPSLKYKILLTSNYANIDQIKKFENEKITLIYNADDNKMCDLMLQADIAISAAGQTLYELARMGVPTIPIQVADNQKDNIQGWKDAGFIEDVGKWDDENLKSHILKNFEILSKKEKRQSISSIGRKWMDGNGARRVAEYCNNLLKGR